MTYFVIFCIAFTAYRFVRRAVVIACWLWKTRNAPQTPFLGGPRNPMRGTHG
jgi:hypothetical protein